MPTDVPENSFAARDHAQPSFALKGVGLLFFLFVLFPAVSFIPLPIQTDTQPNALLMAALVFLVGRRVPLPLPVWMLVVLFIGASVMLIIGGGTMDGIRSLVGYATIFTAAAATLVLSRSNIRLPDKLLDFTVYVWAFVGCVQLFAWRPFMTFLVTASRMPDTRGVASLSNEPSLYATTMLFYILIYFIRGRERSLPVLICLIQIVLFAQSALGILFVIMMFGLYALLRLSAPMAIMTVLALSAALFALVIYGADFLAGTRIGSLLLLLKENPWRIIQLDESVSQRVASIFYSLKGTIDNYLLPRGFNDWKDYSFAQDTAFKGTFSSGSRIDRIMSGYGTALFEMGWVGLTVPILVTLAITKSIWSYSRSRAVAFGLVTHLLLLTPVPLAFPLTGLLIGELFSSKTGGRRPKQGSSLS